MRQRETPIARARTHKRGSANRPLMSAPLGASTIPKPVADTGNVSTDNSSVDAALFARDNRKPRTKNTPLAAHGSGSRQCLTTRGKHHGDGGGKTTGSIVMVPLSKPALNAEIPQRGIS